jgi:hypothetical protein
MEKLRKLIRTAIYETLNEEAFPEPSEDLLKQAMAVFKTNTGINVPMPTLKVKDKRYELVIYEIDMAKQLNTPLLKALYSSMTLKVEASSISSKIGGFAFKFTLQWRHPSGGSNGYTLGNALYYDNSFKWRS